MARQIAVILDGVTTCFDFKKVDRSKLYGRRVRVPLDGDGVLEREVRLAPTLAQANELAETMIVKGVKRGWNAV